MSIGTIWAIAVKDLRQFFRDRTLMLFMFLLPVMQLMLLAQATAQGVENMPVGVVDFDRSAESRTLIGLMVASEILDVKSTRRRSKPGSQASNGVRSSA